MSFRLRLPLVLLLSGALAGCGNKGDLYRSDDPEARRSPVPESTIVPRPSERLASAAGTPAGVDA